MTRVDSWLAFVGGSLSHWCWPSIPLGSTADSRSLKCQDVVVCWTTSPWNLKRETPGLVSSLGLVDFFVEEMLLVHVYIMFTHMLSLIIMVQWKMVRNLKGNYYWRDPFFTSRILCACFNVFFFVFGYFWGSKGVSFKNAQARDLRFAHLSSKKKGTRSNQDLRRFFSSTFF